MKSIILFFLLAFAGTAHAVIESYEFKDPQGEHIYNELIFELRCLVCQNQNLADSNAELAQDLRREVHKMINEDGADKSQVIDFMVQRYGDFVLYRPPFKLTTVMLWVGPFALLVLGFFMMRGVLQKGKEANAAQITDSERSEARELLDK